jgi:hypothetical protein
MNNEKLTSGKLVQRKRIRKKYDGRNEVKCKKMK